MINLQSLTPAHYHQSSFLTVHSYTPSLRDSFATSASPLSVNCALYLPPASKEPSADPARQPKTIRICFAHLPLATKVAKAPAGSTNHPTAPGQSLVLSCRMPSWEEILAKGGVQHQDDLFVGGDGKAGVFCEILGGSRPGVKGETILERVHFGDVVFPGVGVGREQEEIPLVGGWEDNSNGTAYGSSSPFFKVEQYESIWIADRVFFSCRQTICGRSRPPPNVQPLQEHRQSCDARPRASRSGRCVISTEAIKTLDSFNPGLKRIVRKLGRPTAVVSSLFAFLSTLQLLLTIRPRPFCLQRTRPTPPIHQLLMNSPLQMILLPSSRQTTTPTLSRRSTTPTVPSILPKAFPSLLPFKQRSTQPLSASPTSLHRTPRLLLLVRSSPSRNPPRPASELRTRLCSRRRNLPVPVQPLLPLPSLTPTLHPAPPLPPARRLLVHDSR
jgi:hypothetical protein